MKRSFLHRGLLVSLFTIAALAVAGTARATCPFCSAETRTLSEEIQMADASVLARLASSAAADPDTGNAKFQIVKVLNGEDLLGEQKEIDTVFFGAPSSDQLFLVSGVGTDYTEWSTPLPLTTKGVEYLGKLADVPASGADRLAFFQEYLESGEPLLAQDAYEEFARAPYSDLHDLKPRIKHDQLIKWIKDPEINPTRRRLYLTMLGVCGTSADLPMLEEMIVSGYDDKKPLVEPTVAGGLAMGGPLDLTTWTEIVKLDERRKKLGLDALIACYMVLRGPDGLNLIDERLLKAAHVEYSYVYSAIMALRFMGEETQIVPRERLLTSVRLLLDNPDFADQVIPDLARWEDWSVLDRLVNMFKTSNATGYIRPPVVAYLLAAVDQPGEVGPRATAALSDLEKLDPEVVKRARSMMAFGFLARARTVAPAAGAQRPADAEAKAADGVAAKNDSAGQGFGTSAADANNKSDSAAIPPDPATFGKQMAAVTKQDDKGEDAATAPPVPAEGTGKAGAIAPPIAEPSAVAPANGNKPAAAPAAEAATPVDSHTLLIVGLPVAAVVLLAGIYWMIFRSGGA